MNARTKLVTLVATTVLSGLALTGCGHSDDPTTAGVPAKKVTHSAEKYDKKSLSQEAWDTAWPGTPAGVKLDVCKVDAKGGVSAVKTYISGAGDTSDYPFEPVVSTSFDAKQWHKYCVRH